MQISVYLLKDEDKDFNSIIREDISALNVIDLTEQNGFDITLVVGPAIPKEPKWLPTIKKFYNGKLDDYYNQSTRAAILVRVEGHIVAYTFGYGRYLLKDDFVIKDFGIKFVLNIVNPGKLKGLDKTTLNEYMVQSKQLANRNVSINTLELDKIKDLVKRVAGQSDIEKFGSVISGSDVLCIDVVLDVNSILELSKELFNTYSLNNYKDNFEWYDNIQAEKDKSIVSALNRILITDLKKDSPNALLLVPEIAENLLPGDMSLTKKGKKYKFDICNVANYFKEKERDLSFDSIQKMHIYLHNTPDEEPKRWKLFHCLNFETEYNDSIYILYEGNWYKVLNEFFNEIMEYLMNIPVSELDLVVCDSREWEKDYIVRACGLCDNYLIMNEKCVDRIEVCDILTKDKKLIHIKPWTSSSTLSHLFSQGRISADLLLNDTTFRAKVIEKIKSLDVAFDNIISYEYNASEYEVVYAIIYKEDKPLVERIPFFSKINLKQSVEVLVQMGYNVGVKQIKRLEKDSCTVGTGSAGVAVKAENLMETKLRRIAKVAKIRSDEELV